MTSLSNRLELKALQERRATKNVVTSPLEKARDLAMTQATRDLRLLLGIDDKTDAPSDLSNPPQGRESSAR